MYVIQISRALLGIQNSRATESLTLLQQAGIRIVILHGAKAQIY